MNLFKRRKAKTDTNLPPEVQAYSQAERRERMGMAWLVGIVSLIVSLVLVTGLFFGGRWVYRKIADRGDKPTPVVTENNGSQNEGNDQNDENSDSGSTDESTDESAAEQPETIPSTNPDAPSGSNSSTSTQTPTQQPVTGDQSVVLPNTGPSEDN